MKFFEKIVLTLDIETDPDVLVQIYRLEFAEAKEVAGMLNELIGGTSKDDGGAPASKDKSAGAGTSKALRDYIASRPKSDTEQASKIGELS